MRRSRWATTAGPPSIRHVGLTPGFRGRNAPHTTRIGAFKAQSIGTLIGGGLAGGWQVSARAASTTTLRARCRDRADPGVPVRVGYACPDGRPPRLRPPAAQPPAPRPDALGRDTPRGSVLGFLDAAGKGKDEIAAQYLSTRLGKPAPTLAHQLFVVLDARLPARLTQVSDSPEGSRANPLKPNEEIVGAVPAGDGSIDIVVERVAGPDAKAIWLFSAATLNAVPTLYSEVTFGLDERALPRILTGRKIGGVRVVEWLVVLLGIPLFYFATVLLDRLLRPLVAGLWRMLFKDSTLFEAHLLPMPVRLLLVAVGTRWLLSTLPLPLMLRQVGSNAAALLTIAALVWLVILFNRQFEARVIRRFPVAQRSRGAIAGACRAQGRGHPGRSSSACWRRSAISASMRRPRLPVSALAVSRWRWRPRRPSRT